MRLDLPGGVLLLDSALFYGLAAWRFKLALLGWAGTSTFDEHTYTRHVIGRTGLTEAPLMMNVLYVRLQGLQHAYAE
jgi:hypothetical protein